MPAASTPPVGLFFGSFIDVSMNALSWLQPEMYVLKIASLLLGCVIWVHRAIYKDLQEK